MQELNASSMVNVVWALAKTDYAGNGNRRSRTLLDNIAKLAMSHMEAFTPEQLSRLLWAFSTLHHYHAQLYDAIAAETMQQVSNKLHSYIRHSTEAGVFRCADFWDACCWWAKYLSAVPCSDSAPLLGSLAS